MRYPDAVKVPRAVTVTFPSELAMLPQSKIPLIWSGIAALMVTKHSPAEEMNRKGALSDPGIEKDRVTVADVG